ncbi:MAG: hypothetical protein AAF351_10205 [Pseudomonadota bacterium]
MTLFIEELLIGSMTYKSTTPNVTYDDLEYNFNFEVILAGDNRPTRVATETLKVDRDIEYTFLVSGNIAAPTITVWSKPERTFNSADTFFEAQFAHADASLGAVDVYFLDPATAPALGLEEATLNFGEISPLSDYTEGDFILTITTAGDPSDVLFVTDVLNPAILNSFIIGIFEGDANDLSPVAVRSFSSNGFESSIEDISTTATIRFFHAAPGLVTSDIYTDEDLMSQILANHAERDVTGDIPLDPASIPLTYTEAGNVGNILLESTVNIVQGNHYHFYVVGPIPNGTGDPLADLRVFFQVPDRRPVETVAKFRLAYASTNHEITDFYIVPTGGDITELPPLFVNVGVGTQPLPANLIEGDFEMYLTVADDPTMVIAGPIPLTTALGDVIEYVIYDNADPATADIVLIPDP